MPKIVQPDSLFSISKLIIALVLSLVILILGILGLFDLLQNTISDNAQGFFAYSRDRLSQAIPNISYFQSRKKYLQEIESLESQINTLREENVKLDQANKDLELIKKQNKFNKEYKTTPALVTSYLPDRFGHIVINKGSQNKIKDGDAVVIEGYLLGIISELRENSSTVTLINSPESAIPSAGIKHNARGLVVGDISQGLIMQDIPGNSTIDDNEVIVTASLNSILPRGLILGKVENVNEAPSLANKTAELEILVDLANLNQVFILTER